MRSFAGIVAFELRYYLKRISTWVYFGIFLLLSFLLAHLLGGAWEQVQMSVGGSGGNIHVNSPYATAQLSGAVSLFAVLVTAALLGNAIVRDFDTGVHPLFFTTPISRASYLGGRFTGAMLVNTVILNYMALHGEEGNFANLFMNHGLGDATLRDSLTAFEAIVSGTIGPLNPA